jgi:hypothetical protein
MVRTSKGYAARFEVRGQIAEVRSKTISPSAK